MSATDATGAAGDEAPLGGIKSWREVLLPPTLQPARPPPLDSYNLAGHFAAVAPLRHSHTVRSGSLLPGRQLSCIQEQL